MKAVQNFKTFLILLPQQKRAVISNAAIESLLSGAQDLISETRTRLKPQRIESIMLSSSFLPFSNPST